MKRLFILASATIVALASCSKTQVVYNDAPEEIGFKTYAGAMTKATTVALTADDMGVFAYQGDALYFNNTDFEKRNSETYWTAETPKYWPVDGTLTFTVYSPYDASVKYYNVANASDPEVNAKTLYIVADDETLKDWLYGTTQPTGTKATEHVDVTLAHALSNIEVNVTGEAAIKLKGVELLSTYQKGVCKVEYASPLTVSWTATNPAETTIALYTPTDATNGDALSDTKKTVSRLVVPTTTLSNEAIKLTYRVDGMEETAADLTYVTTTNPSNALGSTWEHGKKYIYNIYIGANEIEFNPLEEIWDEQAGVDVSPTI